MKGGDCFIKKKKRIEVFFIFFSSLQVAVAGSRRRGRALCVSMTRLKGIRLGKIAGKERPSGDDECGWRVIYAL